MLKTAKDARRRTGMEAYTVLVGVDGGCSGPAAEWALQRAVLAGGRLRLLHVDPGPAAMLADLASFEPVPMAEVLCSAMLRRTANELRLRAPGVQLSAGAVTGDPSSALLAASHDADLL